MKDYMNIYPDTGKLFRRLCSADNPEKLWEAADFACARHPLFYNNKTPAEILRSEASIVLYGAGRFAEAVIDAWQKIGVNPCHCIDSDPKKWGTLLRNIPVLNPRVLADYRDSTPLVMIAAMTTHDIEKTLREKQISFFFAERDGSIGYLSGHWLLDHRIEFEKLYFSLTDDASRRVMLEVAKARLFQHYYFPMRGNFFSAEIATLPQYFSEDILSFANNEFFIDCGAFDGDTLIAFSALMHRLGGYHWQAIAFEADTENARRVIRTLEDYEISQVKLVNAAIGEHGGKASADCFHNCQSKEKLSDEIQVLALDEALKDVSPTFIKMDIEGSELAALRGARQTILTYYPKLAICIYHSTSDLLEIPLFILENFPDYKLYIRHHSPSTLWETVCYAVPGRVTER